MTDGSFEVALGRLRQSLAEMKKTDVWDRIVEPRDGVLARFQPLLTPEHIPGLSADEIRPFFYIEHNHHWSGLNRQVNRVCDDMTILREALLVLVDESIPIDRRLDEASHKVTGMGKAILTALLIVTYPDKYGVWNGTSEDGLVELGIFPDFARGTSFGAKYETINETLNKLASALEIDLWTLDALWWHILRDEELSDSQLLPDSEQGSSQQSDIRFGLERHLHNFLMDNWDHTELAKDWAIYDEPGEPDAGYEFRCPIGRIDLLARHHTEKKWLVIELKRGRSSDQAVGQVLRYIGWVQAHLAETDEAVEGLIISRSGDDSLQYAVSAVPNLAFMTYEVDFRLISSMEGD